MCLFALFAHSQKFYKAKLFFTNGDIKEGYAEIPTNKTFDSSVSFKAGEKGKATKIKDEEIDKAIYYSDNGNEFYFENTSVKQTFGKKMERTPKKKSWILITYHHPLITVYSYAQSYYIDKDGRMISQTIDYSGTWADIFICYKRPGEEVPTIITSFTQGAKIIGQQKQFRTAAKRYFNGDDNFISRIEQKEFSHDQVYEMAEAYVAYKQNEK